MAANFQLIINSEFSRIETVRAFWWPHEFYFYRFFLVRLLYISAQKGRGRRKKEKKLEEKLYNQKPQL
jgi:hypothetical protein